MLEEKKANLYEIVRCKWCTHKRSAGRHLDKFADRKVAFLSKCLLADNAPCRVVSVAFI